MSQRSGSADLPLHGGHVPRWLADRMTRLGTVMSQAIVHTYGRDEFLRRLAHPFWFQSFGAVMGMDWHSSGITTSVLGALKRGLTPLSGELGIHVCGGRGRHSRATPAELLEVGRHTGLDGEALGRTSKLVAKVDSAAVQDGFDLYLHGFIVSDEGRWVVVQQGMDPGSKQARRYHWLSERLTSFVDAPHSAIEGNARGKIVNLADVRAAASRTAQIEVLDRLGPDGVTQEYCRLRSAATKPAPDKASGLPQQLEMLPHLSMPDRHDLRSSDVVARRLHGNLAAAAECGPRDFTELLQVPGVGARTVQALSLVAEVLHGTPCRFSDPARFSLAHGGKDGHPFPVPLKVYDETIGVLRRAVERAKLGDGDRLAAIKRLDEQACRIDAVAMTPAQFDRAVAAERAAKASLGGRTVADDRALPAGDR